MVQRRRAFAGVDPCHSATVRLRSAARIRGPNYEFSAPSRSSGNSLDRAVAPGHVFDLTHVTCGDVDAGGAVDLRLEPSFGAAVAVGTVDTDAGAGSLTVPLATQPGQYALSLVCDSGIDGVRYGYNVQTFVSLTPYFRLVTERVRRGGVLGVRELTCGLGAGEPITLSYSQPPLGYG